MRAPGFYALGALMGLMLTSAPTQPAMTPIGVAGTLAGVVVVAFIRAICNAEGN